MAIAHLYRKDYRDAGMRMMSLADQDGKKAAWFAVILLPFSLLPTFFGINGPVYCSFAVALGLGYLLSSLGFTVTRSFASAKNLFWMSLVYLPGLLGIMMVDRIWGLQDWVCHGCWE